MDKIENGFHIHHIDGDKSNNNISNLKKISSSEHYKIHLTDEKRERSRKWVDLIRPLTKKWHASEEGIEWHRKHGVKVWENRIPFKIKCLFCLKEVETKTYHQKFCHQNCKAKHGRRVQKNKRDTKT